MDVMEHLANIMRLATEIEESPHAMGGPDIDRLAELKNHTRAAVAVLAEGIVTIVTLQETLQKTTAALILTLENRLIGSTPA
jgi:hypothetical protein